MHRRPRQNHRHGESKGRISGGAGETGTNTTAHRNIASCRVFRTAPSWSVTEAWKRITSNDSIVAMGVPVLGPRAKYSLRIPPGQGDSGRERMRTQGGKHTRGLIAAVRPADILLRRTRGVGRHESGLVASTMRHRSIVGGKMNLHSKTQPSGASGASGQAAAGRVF